MSNAPATAKQISLKTPSEIEIMRKANQIVAGALNMLREKAAEGVSTWELDLWAEEFARQHGAVPAFKGYHGFPGSLCVSLNEQVVHGIPSKKVILTEGDIVSIDFGVRYQGFYGDAAVTLAIGEIDAAKADLLKVTRESLYVGIEQARVGKRINDISAAIQAHVEKHGYSVVKQFVGHGIGAELHEGPEVPNYSTGKKGTPRIMAGMVLAIEPMVNFGTFEVKVLKDGWTVITKDKSPSAHFEHSVAVTEEGPIILSDNIH
ncbi:MAG: type I methionyl aminopeptidase [Deltaproteobacteria bacterium]|nr:MAG: type I methionyl aminopeptidase [Deltaproteobacteria bacterium]